MELKSLPRSDESKTTMKTASSPPQDSTWVWDTFKKRECIKYIPTVRSNKEKITRCGCGMDFSGHQFLNEKGSRNGSFKFVDETTTTTFPLATSITTTTTNHNSKYVVGMGNGTQIKTISSSNMMKIPSLSGLKSLPIYNKTPATQQVQAKDGLKWNSLEHTKEFPTDAYGTLEFQGTGEGDKSQYLRFAHDTCPASVLSLLIKEWNLKSPNLVITVHGGSQNFQLQPKIRRAFCDGLIKAAETTGAWVMSYGLDRGIGRIVGKALREHKQQSRSKICSIGVAPWGMVDHRENLIGNESIKAYQTMSNPVSKGAVLNTAYSNFLFVDNGSVGRCDCEIQFRRLLEERLSQMQTQPGRGSLSMVCVVLEGGKNVINVVQKCVQQIPPIPVIVCDGSGRAADLLAFAHQHADEDGDFQDDDVRQQFLSLVEDSFKCTHEQANFYLTTITDCVKRKDLVTVFRLGQGQDDMDRTILTISLKARCKSAPEMLKLAQSWDRADIAASQIFVYGQKWPVMSLENAMMDALAADQVNFVKLLMDHGVSMHKFLTIGRLEYLYNTIKLPLNIKHLLKDVKTVRYSENSLIDIGYVIESLMGGGYKSTYTKKSFRSPYTKVRAASKAMKAKTGQNYSNQMCRDARHDLHPTLLADMGMKNKATYDLDQFNSKHFSYPFHELLVWAVLFQRQKMALFMWQHGEEALAKALVAYRLYKVMADEAADDDLDGVEFRHLEDYATDFEGIAVKLLDVCYRADENATKKLLTYELNEWSKQTCLNLAVGAKHRDFIAHPCCQLLLNDLWHGPLAFRKFSVPKLIVGMFCPLYICTLQFKTQNELQYVGHANHFNIDNTSSPSWSSLSESSDRTSSSSYGELVVSKRLKCPASRQPIDTVPAMRADIPKYSKFSLTLWLDFWKAPVTKFYSFIISYMLFLLNFDTLVLRKQDKWSPIQEYLIMLYVVAAACDMIHEVMISEASSFVKKLKISLCTSWKLIEILKYLLFVTGFFLRFGHTHHHLEVRLLLYYLSACLWNMYLLAILGKTKTFGPTVTLMGKMIADLFIVCCVLLVLIIAFGVTRTAITKPGKPLSTETIKDVLMEPYFMLYGEVYADTIDPCDSSDPSLCHFGAWIIPIMECVFLLAACLIGLNLLIARFNSTYQYLRPHSDKIWMFGRYHIIWQLARQPALPIPFSLFSYIWQFISYSCCRRPRRNYGLKLYLDNLSVEKLHDFEEESVDDFFRNRKQLPECLIVEQNKPNVDETAKQINDKVEESIERQLLLERNVIDVADRFDWLCRYNSELVDYIRRQEIRRNDSSREFSTGVVGGVGGNGGENSDDEFSNHHQQQPMPMRITNGVIARRRMRIRQDSEMSTTSGWMYPPYSRSRSYQERMNPTANKPATQMCHSTTLTKIRSTGALENLQDNYSSRRHPRLLRQSSLDGSSSGNIEKDQRKTFSCFNLLQQTDSSGSSDGTRNKKRKLNNDEDDESYESGMLNARSKRLSRSLTLRRRGSQVGTDEDDGQLSWKSFPTDKLTTENSLECDDDEPPFYSETNISDLETPPPNITQFEMDSDCYHDEGGDIPPTGRLTSRPPRPMRKTSTNYSSITDQIVIRQHYESFTDVPVFENTPVMNFGRVRCARRQKLNINESLSTSMKPPSSPQAFEKRLRYRNRTKKSKVKSFDNPNQSSSTTKTNSNNTTTTNNISGDNRKKAQKKYQFFTGLTGVKWRSSNQSSGAAGSRGGAEDVFRSQEESQTPSPE